MQTMKDCDLVDKFMESCPRALWLAGPPAPGYKNEVVWAA